MRIESIQKAIETLQQQPKRKFVQTVDLIINLKNLDLKQHPVDFYVMLPKEKGKALKICAFVDLQLGEQTKRLCEKTITDAEFINYSPKEAKRLATEYDFFIAQANFMPKIATTFGKYLGIRGKMPSPKLGNIVPPGTNLEPLVKRLRATVRLSAKKGTNIQCMVGRESMNDADVIANIQTVYEALSKQVPSEHNNIKNVWLKLTMSKPVKVVDDGQ